MALMDILEAAQGGALFANAGKATGLSAGDAAKAMKVLCPAIAAQLKAKSQEDAGTFEALVDLLEDDADGSLIDDPGSLNGGEATAGGAAPPAISEPNASASQRASEAARLRSKMFSAKFWEPNADRSNRRGFEGPFLSIVI